MACLAVPLALLVLSVFAPPAAAVSAPAVDGALALALSAGRAPAAAPATVLARGRGGIGIRPRSGSRSPYRSPAYRRRSPSIGNFFGGALRFLGIAYLVNALFGWGPGGGSPFGLLIVVAVVALLVHRSRARRRERWGYGAA